MDLPFLDISHKWNCKTGGSFLSCFFDPGQCFQGLSMLWCISVPHYFKKKKGKTLQEGDCSHEIKRCLLLGRKAMTKLDSILKSQRHYFANKGLSSQSYGFSNSHIWMWELNYKESCRIDAFELWYWRRLLRIPWTAGRSNQSILKEISPKYSLEGLMLKLQSFGHLIRRTDSGKDPDAGKDWRQEEKGMTEDDEWHHWPNGHEFEQAPGVGDGQGSLACCSPWGCKE